MFLRTLLWTWNPESGCYRARGGLLEPKRARVGIKPRREWTRPTHPPPFWPSDRPTTGRRDPPLASQGRPRRPTRRAVAEMITSKLVCKALLQSWCNGSPRGPSSGRVTPLWVGVHGRPTMGRYVAPRAPHGAKNGCVGYRTMGRPDSDRRRACTAAEPIVNGVVMARQSPVPTTARPSQNTTVKGYLQRRGRTGRFRDFSWTFDQSEPKLGLRSSIRSTRTCSTMYVASSPSEQAVSRPAARTRSSTVVPDDQPRGVPDV